MWVVVYRPVKELIDGTHRVAGGDLDYRLPVRSDDELGDLAASFNKMTAEVARRAGQDRGAGAAQDGRTGARPQDPAALGEDGLHRQAGRHRGARDQQPAVRHPDLRAAGAARAAEAGIPGPRRAGRAAPDHRAREQAVRRPGEEPADLLAPGAQQPRAERPEHRGRTAPCCW